jgi:hypothetical protein
VIVGGRHAHVHGLAAREREPVERLRRERDEVARGRLAAGIRAQHRARRQRPAHRVALDEALPLERRDEARGGALRQPAALGELADGGRLGGLDEMDEQLRRSVDRLGAGVRGGSGHRLISWNARPTM